MTVPRRTYFIVYAVLVLCTYLTVQLAFFDLGRLNAVAAVGIAAVKATLVALFFMHVKYSTRLTWLVVLGGLFWLGILMSMTATDYLTRPWRTYG